VTTIADRWEQLQGQLPPFGEFVAHVVQDSPAIFLAVDHEATPHLLLALSEDATFSDDRSRGIQAAAHRLRVEQRPEGPFLDVRCTDASGLPMFRMVTSEIIEATGHGVPAVQAVENTLARWRRFWGDVPQVGLTPDQVRGLFGELWFLYLWLLPLDIKHVEHWAGPNGGRHDFQWPGRAVECKATNSLRGHIHRINGIDQLVPPDKGTLHVFSLRVKDEESATNSLVTIIGRIREAIGTDAALADRFELTLAHAGYSPVHDDRYRPMTFFVLDERLYRVGSGFPRLTPKSFAGGLPAGVERIEYEINLGSAEALCVAKNPGQLPPELATVR
jgi:putative PD-(D/E)XK family protein DUF4420